MNIKEKIGHLFGDVSMSWKRVIIFAIAAGAYTGIINQIPAVHSTSLDDIAVSYELWVLFAVLIAVNCKKPLEAGLKVFVFFLISQPLCFLVEIPMLGLSQAFYYFRLWIVMILLTFPGGIVVFFAKKNNIIGALVTAAACSIIAVSLVYYGLGVITDFPGHLLTTVFCLVTIILFIMFIVKKNRLRAAAAVITIAVCLVTGYKLWNTENEMSVEIPAGYTHCSLAVEDGSQVSIDPEAQCLYYTYKPYNTAAENTITISNDSNQKIVYEVIKGKTSVNIVKAK